MKNDCVEKLLEFFLELSLNSVNSANSGNPINHWSMNWAQFKDPVPHMHLAGTVVASWSLTQEVVGLSSFTVMTNIFTARKQSLWRLCFYRCLSVHMGGVHVCLGGMVVAPGGVHGCSWGACVVGSGGHAWLLPGGGGIHGYSGGACMVAPEGACVVAPRGHAWDMMRYGDTINEQAECILVVTEFAKFSKNI